MMKKSVIFPKHGLTKFNKGLLIIHKLSCSITLNRQPLELGKKIIIPQYITSLIFRSDELKLREAWTTQAICLSGLSGCPFLHKGHKSF